MHAHTLSCWSVAGVALALAAVCAPAHAQAPARVAVKTEFAAPRFRLTFRDRTLPIQDSVTTRLVAMLGDDARFLRFTRADPTSRYRLVFTLDRRQRNSNAPFPEYGFWVRLDRPDGTPIELYWKTLRPAGVTSQGIGTEREFLDDVDAMLIEPELGPIRTELLSKVPIATTTLASRSPVGWALPIPNDSLCMQKFTMLEVFAVFKEGSGQGVDRPDTARVVSQPFAPPSPGPRQQPFLRNLFSEPRSQAARDALSRSLARGSVEGKEVFVLDYRRDPNVCRSPVQPGAARPGGNP